MSCWHVGKALTTQMQPSPISNSDRLGLEYLISDMDLALTFLQIAATSSDRETRERNRKNARKAYETVLHFLPRLDPTAEERQTIEEKLAALRTRLQALGEID